MRSAERNICIWSKLCRRSVENCNSDVLVKCKVDWEELWSKALCFKIPYDLGIACVQRQCSG